MNLHSNLFFEVVVTAIAASHVLTMALITAWFGLRKPKSWEQLRRNLRQEYDMLFTGWKED